MQPEFADAIESVEIDVNFEEFDEDSAIELTDDDLVCVAIPPIPVSESVRPAARSWSDDGAMNVAEECLASIVAETSRARIPVPELAAVAGFAIENDRTDRTVTYGKLPPPSPPRRPVGSMPTIPPPVSASALALSPRLPPVRPPPFNRSTRVPDVSRRSEDADHAATPLPTTPFARRTQGDIASPYASVAPVAVSPEQEPTLPRAWVRTAGLVAAAALFGALSTVTLTRLANPRPASRGTVAATAPAPATVERPARRVRPAAVVTFTEEEGISIQLPASAAPPLPPAPRTSASAHPAPPASPAAGEGPRASPAQTPRSAVVVPARKAGPSPEELAEVQLRASIR